ncbi:MAG: hypothetical protein ABIB79_00255 [archaeon]
MGWKEWNFIKKGTLIGLIVGILPLIITYIGLMLCFSVCPDSLENFFEIIVKFSVLSVKLLPSSIYNLIYPYGILVGIIGFIGNLILFALIGAFIGFLISKFKPKSKK